MKLNIYALAVAVLMLAGYGTASAQQQEKQPDVYEQAEQEADRLQGLLDLAAELKSQKKHGIPHPLYPGKNIALITDAGTPGISDPGEELVKMAREASITVTSLPGACACVTALTISGLPTRRFAFEAFLPSDKKECRQVLADLQEETRTIILYEAPHRLKKTMALLLETLGDRQMTVCRELTKKHEATVSGLISEVIAHFEAEEPRGECVLVIRGKDFAEFEKEEQAKWQEMSIEEHVAHYLSQGMDKKEAMKAAAADRGISKRDVYRALLEK